MAKYKKKQWKLSSSSPPVSLSCCRIDLCILICNGVPAMRKSALPISF